MMGVMSESLSISQARKLVLLSQRVLSPQQGGSAKAATLSAIEHLGYIQIDAISVIERAHHHTLWNRNPRYQGSQLDELVAEKEVFEYWSHAAAYLPMRDYRFSLPRKQALASGEQSHWFERDEAVMKRVIERITKEGPLMAKDFEYRGKRMGEWKTKPAKRALESLFMQGDLMAAGRVNFHKVYDLTKRVLPEGLDVTLPEPVEYARYLITRYLRANGLGQVSEMVYLLKDIRPLVFVTLEEMVASGEVVTLQAVGESYYALSSSLELLNKSLARSRLKILSPFDNLVIQRERMKTLFGFDYLIECYVPKEKRKYGYFSLPVLWDGKLVARMDCKVERKEAVLHIRHLALEPSILKVDSFLLALGKELKAFLKFNGCAQLQLHKVSPESENSKLLSVLDELMEN